MANKLAENIRENRKQKKLTQEGLAELMGVSVAAVSKWETGASVPDIDFIIAMAQLFSISVDSLLGYEMVGDNAAVLLEKLKALKDERKLDEAMALADKALSKYPNNFEIIYEASRMYRLALFLKMSDKKATKACAEKSLKLCQRAIELISQNKDPELNEAKIMKDCADIYLYLGQNEKAYNILKENNPFGINNSAIGSVLTNHMGRHEEALQYFSRAFVDVYEQALAVCIGQTNCYIELREYDKAYEVISWTHDYLGSLAPKEGVFFGLKIMAVCSALQAILILKAGEAEKANMLIKRAYEEATTFDANPIYDLRQSILMDKLDKAGVAYDDLGESAIGAVKNVIAANESDSDDETHHELDAEFAAMRKVFESLLGEKIS